MSISINVGSGFDIFLFALVCGLGFEVGRSLIISALAITLRLMNSFGYPHQHDEGDTDVPL